jgi:hypothetical protein
MVVSLALASCIRPMGPTVVFDKSFLQTLTVDESVWFDHHFVGVITPLFFVETLADLEKERIRAGRTPEDEVRIIAEKVPEMNSVPHIHHVTLCHGELLGFEVPFQGRPVISGGTRTQVGEKRGIVFGVLPEAEALNRWRREEYREIERRFASGWRQALVASTRDAGSAFVDRYRAAAAECTTREQLRALAQSIVRDTARPAVERMGFVIEFLGLREHGDEIFVRFLLSGTPAMATYAPYTAHVLEVELFFRFATQRGIIAGERASNRVDIAYLNYLPTCHVFVSTDRLHRDNAPLFLRDYQTFVWGEDLKADLKRINEFRKSLPQEVRDRGLMSFAPRPPTEGDFLTSRLWDLAMKPTWRTPRPIELSEETQKKLIESMKMLKKKAESQTEPAPIFSTEEADAITVARRVKMTKGSWTQLSPDVLGREI